VTTPNLDSFKARTGLASHPGVDYDSETAWQIWAGMGDLDGHPNQLVVNITAPDIGDWGTVVLDVAFNSTSTFEFMREGYEQILPDVAGLGPDLVVSQSLNDLGGGQFSTVSGGVSSLSRLYFDTRARAISAIGGFTYSQPSMVLGEWPPSGPFPADQLPVKGDWLIYEAPDTASMGQPDIAPLLIGGYFLGNAQVRVHGLAQTYPNFPEYGRVASTSFEVGDPSLISFLSPDGDYTDGRRNLSATATSKGFARW
jgi:hypothetical protein